MPAAIGANRKDDSTPVHTIEQVREIARKFLREVCVARYGTYLDPVEQIEGWPCVICTFVNPENVVLCDACQTRRPASPASLPGPFEGYLSFITKKTH